MTKRPRRRGREVPPPRAVYLQRDQTVPPAPISELLGEVFERAARTDRRAVSLMEEWGEIAGPPWSKSRPVALRNGVLTVEVPSGSEASILRFEVGDLQTAITRRFGADLVTAVRLRVGGRGRREPL